MRIPKGLQPLDPEARAWLIAQFRRLGVLHDRRIDRRNWWDR